MPSSLPTQDVVSRAWGPVTVRVAWTLAAHGVAVKPEVLRDARDHVWLCLSSEASVERAEDEAERLTLAFVARARGRTWSEPFPHDRDLVLRPSWRDRLFRGLSRPASYVLRLHYGDGHTLEAVAKRVNDDLMAVEAAREGLREVLRRTAAKDGEDLDDWEDARVDALLHRLVVRTVEGGPALEEVVDGLHPDHAARCLTAARAQVLVRKGALQRADLVQPRVGGWPTERVRVLGLHLHPLGRRHLEALLAELGGRAFPLADDLVVLDASDLEGRRAILWAAAEVGVPSRDHVRGVLLEGPGRWTRHGLIGPLVERVPLAIRALPWGYLEGVGELPDRRPAPPSARWAWTAVTALAAASALVLTWAMQPAPLPADHPLALSVDPSGADGLWVDLHVDDAAHLVVITDEGTRLSVLLDGSTPAAKAEVAVGDGGYRLRAPALGVLVASASTPVPELAALVKQAGAGGDALDRLGAVLLERVPGADVRVARR